MDYVLCWPQYPKSQYESFPSILVVGKNKPEWQVGRFNLVGGKIEPGESPIEAAIRELKEESGINHNSDEESHVYGQIVGSWGKVYVVNIPVTDTTVQQPPSETEQVMWLHWNDLKDNFRLMPNLRVIIPLMITGLKGWIIHDEGPTWDTKTHTFSCEVKSDDKERKWKNQKN